MIGGRGPLQEHKVKITEEHIKLLRKKAVAALLGVDPYTVTLWVKKGLSTPDAPARWRLTTINEWIAKRERTRRPRPKPPGCLRPGQAGAEQ